MRTTAGMSLPEAEHAVEEAHPGWHVWHSDGLVIYATTTACDLGGCGTTLCAPTCEQVDHVIAEWEYKHAEVAA